MANKKYSEFTAGTPAGSDVVLYGNPTTGALKKVTIDNMSAAVGLGIIKRTKVTLDYTDFAAEQILVGQTYKGPVEVFTLPAGGVFHSMHINNPTLFATDEGFYYTVEVNTTNVPSWLVQQDVLTAVDVPSGNGFLFEMESYSTPSIVTVQALSDAPLANATAGVLDIWIYYSVLD